MTEEKWQILQSKVTEFCLKVTDKNAVGNKNVPKKSTEKVKAVAPKSALKSKRSEKAESKLAAQKGGVKFNTEVETHVFGERKWNDFKQKGHTFKKGNFTSDEIQKLMNTLCNYVKQQEEGEASETLTILCTRSKHEMPESLKGAWPKIAECLQDRSVQSCHNVCRRKFNPNNYHGSWTKDEEQMMQNLISIHGKTWKTIAEKMVEMGGRGRTAGNIKDKFKQMGEDSASKRDLGPWSLDEGLRLFENVCTASGVQAMRQSMKLVVNKNGIIGSGQQRYEVDEAKGELRVFDQSKVQLAEILPHLIKPKRAYKHFCESQQQIISWKALSENAHKTRSVDDIRNFWMLKIVPMLQTYGGGKKVPGAPAGGVAARWTEADDINLLEAIECQDLSDAEEPIDFSSSQVGNERSVEANRARWTLLLKGLCAMTPGRKFKPSQTARTMIDDIRSQPEKYVAWAVPKSLVAKKRQRTGLNHYVNIHDYYKEHFANSISI